MNGAGARARIRSDRRLNGGWALLLIAVATGMLRAMWLGDPAASADEQLYSLIGNRMVAGDLPFVDVWDRKPIGLFALYAFAHWIGGPQPIAYQVLALAFSVGGGWLTFALARPIAGWASGVAAALLYQLLMIAYGSHAGQSEIFHVPMMLAALLLLRDWRPGRLSESRPDSGPHQGPWRAIAAMLVCGLALQVKYTVLPQCLFMGLVALWRLREGGARLPRIAAHAAIYALIGIAPTALAGTAYALAGHWHEFAFANFQSFFDRLPSDAGRFGQRHLLAVMPLAALLGGGVWAAVRIAPPRPRRHYALIAGWTLSALATVLLPSTVYLYYYAALVPGVVLLALPLYNCRRMIGVAMALALVVVNYALLDMPARFQQTRQRRASVARLAAAIAPHMQAGGPCLYIHDGPSVLYTMAGKCLPGRFVYPDHLNNLLETPALGTGQAAEVARILATAPPVIVTANRPLTPQAPAVQALVRQALVQDYHRAASDRIDQRVISVWLRN
ncbi:MAG: hypothetical protein RLZZ08_1815 [Pseudomonadota bacterium]|jgi:hypothetical protein